MTAKEARCKFALDTWNNCHWYVDEAGQECHLSTFHNYQSADSGYVTSQGMLFRRNEIYRQIAVDSFAKVPKWFKQQCGAK